MTRRPYFLFALLLCSITTNIFSQSNLERLVATNDKPFIERDIVRSSDTDTRYRQQVSEYRIHQVDKAGITLLSEKKPAALMFRIPSSQGELELQLVRHEITTEDYQVILNGQELYGQEAQGVHYRGIVKNMEGSLAAVSISRGEISVLASTRSEGNFVFKKIKDSEEYLSFYERDVRIASSKECGVDETFRVGTMPDINVHERTENARAGECIRIHIEGNWELYRDEGQSVPSTISYLEGMFNVVSTLYANESIDIALSYVNLWTNSNDPFADNTSNDGLSSLQYYVSGGNPINGDLIHLVSGSNEGNGGLAWVNTLCSSNPTLRTAYSNVNGYYNGLPLSYSWDTEVFAHEMGHNVGSSHTHSCVWNGNNTQIDDCGNKYVADQGGTPEGNACYNAGSPIIPSAVVGGTVMSYCHLLSAGINFSNGFGTQPGNVLRNAYNNASCLSACNAAACAPPYSVTVSAITGSSATISWTGGGTPDSFKVEYGTGGNFTTLYVVNSPANLISLDANAPYTVTVSSFCGGSESDGSGSSFSTACDLSFGLPYAESFESGAAGWAVSGTSPSWALGTPAKTTISGAADGSNAWTTGGLGTGTYNADEVSFLNSPCIDLTGSSAIEVEFSIWWDIETTWEGAVLQYTINNGANWSTIGTYGEPNNWYNRNDVYTSPDGSGIAWSGNGPDGSGGWLTARHAVNELAGLADVKFRFNFAADNLYQFDGLAIDNFKVFDPNAPCHEITVNAMSCNPLDTGTVVNNLTDVNDCDSIVTVITTLDDLPPTAACQDITVQIGLTGSVDITAADINNGSSDNCGVQSLAADSTNFDCNELGSNAAILTVTDIHGLTSTCSSTVTVEDLAGNCVECVTQLIGPDEGWDIISAYVLPDDPDILSIIDPSKANIAIIKDASGNIVLPGIALNLIGDWDVEQAYKIKTTGPVTLSLGCTQVDPMTTSIALGSGWNLVSYLRDAPEDVTMALSDIANNIEIVKDSKGNIYIPAFALNTIGNMLPGKGYQVKMSAPASLTYDLGGGREGQPIPHTSPATPVHYELDVNTGNNATIVIPENVLDELDAQDEIGVFNSSGLLVGSAVREQGNVALAIWGNDESDEGLSGFLSDNENYFIRVWDHDQQAEYDAEVEFASGSDAYQQDGLNILSKFTVASTVTSVSSPVDPLQLLKVYPNPSSGLFNVELQQGLESDVELKLMDISGRILEIRVIKSTDHFIQNYDLTEMSRGIYLLNVTSESASSTMKINITR